METIYAPRPAPDTSGAHAFASRALPQMVALNVTTRCNLRCIHCYNDSGGGPCGDLGREALLSVAAEVAALRPFNVCLCGGEPLCRPDILDVIDALCPHVGRVTMVTNGFAVTKALAEALSAHGLAAVQVSLDGAYAWQHDSLRGVPGAFDRAQAAIRFFRQAGIPQIMTAILPSRLTLASFEDYVRLCIGLGVDAVRSMPFLPSGRGRTLGRTLMLDAEGYFRWRRQVRNLSDRYGAQIRVEWDDPLGLLTSMPRRTAEGEPNHAVEIGADGSLLVSSYLPIVVGDLTRHSLAEYWRGGYARIFADPRVTAYVRHIHNVYDLDRLDPLPYGDTQIKFDLLEDTL